MAKPPPTQAKGPKGEKPTYQSKQVQMTQKWNEHENQILKKEIRRMERVRISQMIVEREEKKELFNSVKKIQTIRTKAPVTPERKMFLSRNGIRLKDRFFDMDEFLSVMDEEVATPKRFRKKSTQKASHTKISSPLRLNHYETHIKQIQSETPGEDDEVIEPTVKTADSCVVHGTGVDTDAETKAKNNTCTCAKKKNRSYIFRCIEPPINGRAIPSTTATRTAKQRPTHESKMSFSPADVSKRNEANEYRLRLLSRHKMRDQFVPISTLPVDLENDGSVIDASNAHRRKHK